MAQMKWYTTSRNTTNKVKIREDLQNSILAGNDLIYKKFCDIVINYYQEEGRPCVIALDGYMGEEWNSIIKQVTCLLKDKKLTAKVIGSATLFKPRGWIEKLIKTYTDTDAALGKACTDKSIKDILDFSKVKAVKKELVDLKKNSPEKLAAIFCCGIGFAIKDLRDMFDYVYFYDLSRVSVMKKKFADKLREPGLKKPGDIFWKKEMYFYYHILDKHRKEVLTSIDGYLDGNDEKKLKFIPLDAYHAIISALSQQPLKFKRFMQPGNWGGLHHGNYFNLAKLKNCAWDTTFYSPKNSCMVDAGIGCDLEIPFLNIQLQHPKQVAGPYLAKKYPGLLPMIACIDDGYFPRPVKPERSNMPIHLHPDGKYIRKTFNERLGRYETYYIVAAYENANTMLGLTKDADVDEFKRKVIDAEKKGIKFDWTKYIKTWPSKEGDLYLIPAGTLHGTGGHQMILEMDTCPSNVGTEYSFFLYDFLRKSWDDDKKSFTAPPIKLQIKHGFAQARWCRREKWVKKNLLARPHIIRKGTGWREEQYDSYRPMPFHVERMHFEKKIDADTKGRFCHLLFLTKGNRAMIRSKKHPERKIEIEWIQFAFIPAGFGEYECINVSESHSCTIVKQRWKF